MIGSEHLYDHCIWKAWEEGVRGCAEGITSVGKPAKLTSVGKLAKLTSVGKPAKLDETEGADGWVLCRLCYTLFPLTVQVLVLFTGRGVIVGGGV